MKNRTIFRTLVSVEDAVRTMKGNVEFLPTSQEDVPTDQSLGRVLAENVASQIDVPGFDRAGMDGYAVRAQDTFGAGEDRPITLKIAGRVEAGQEVTDMLQRGLAIEIATGAPISRGANAVVMVEYTQQHDDNVDVYRAVTPGENVVGAGTDVMMGEVILRKGQRITPREMGVIAALGLKAVRVYKKPMVAVMSTGNELRSAGTPLKYGEVYDINSSSIAGAVLESGCCPVLVGIAPDEPVALREKVEIALSTADVLVTSGSTSAGAGDLLYRIVDMLGEPGVLVHGLAVKPGKPAFMAIVKGKPVFGLPGYPTSALMIFIQVVRPLLLEMAGCKEMFGEKIVEAKTATKIFSQRGRRELLTVHVVRDESGQFLCYPLTSGSGAITTLAQADGYVDIPESQEIVAEGELIKVRLFGEAPKLSDLVLIGSHCIGVDILLDCVSRLDPSCSFKVINVGSTGGFRAIQRGEADIAGVHLLDENTGEYNWPFIEKYGLEGKANLIRGYKRVQGLMIPKGNPLGIKSLDSLLSGKISFINRNPGSGTRLLIDMLVRKAASKMGLGFRGATETIQGYDTEAKSHSAVALAVKYGRADVGLGIKAAAISAGLDFLPIGEERYDFLVPSKRLKKESVKSFIEALKSDEFKIELSKHAPGLIADAETGVVM